MKKNNLILGTFLAITAILFSSCRNVNPDSLENTKKCLIESEWISKNRDYRQFIILFKSDSTFYVRTEEDLKYSEKSYGNWKVVSTGRARFYVQYDPRDIMPYWQLDDGNFEFIDNNTFKFTKDLYIRK